MCQNQPLAKQQALDEKGGKQKFAASERNSSQNEQSGLSDCFAIDGLTAYRIRARSGSLSLEVSSINLGYRRNLPLVTLGKTGEPVARSGDV